MGGAAGGEKVDISSDGFVNLDVLVPDRQRFTIGADYRMVNALSGLDIGGEGFSPSRFPALQVDAHIIGGRVIANVTEAVSVHGFFGQVVTGWNTAVSRIIGFGVSFAFGAGGVGF